jgi:hypothetical protein
LLNLKITPESTYKLDIMQLNLKQFEVFTDRIDYFKFEVIETNNRHIELLGPSYNVKTISEIYEDPESFLHILVRINNYIFCVIQSITKVDTKYKVQCIRGGFPQELIFKGNEYVLNWDDVTE